MRTLSLPLYVYIFLVGSVQPSTMIYINYFSDTNVIKTEYTFCVAYYFREINFPLSTKFFNYSPDSWYYPDSTMFHFFKHPSIQVIHPA